MFDILRALQLIAKKINTHYIHGRGKQQQCPKIGGLKLAAFESTGFHEILHFWRPFEFSNLSVQHVSDII